MKNLNDMTSLELGTEFHRRLEIATYSESLKPINAVRVITNEGFPGEVEEVLKEIKLRKY